MISFKSSFFISLFFALTQTYAQEKYTVSGSITDAQTGEDLMGVNIYLKTNPEKGTVSNYYGFYSLSLPKGKYEIVYDFIGYQSLTKKIDLHTNLTIDIKLSPTQENLEEVVITGKNKKRNIRSTVLGTHRIQVKAIENLPVLLGEKDILKTIQLLPGVKPAGEGQAGFYVRGGNIDENLILLDGAPVYNASHVLGFFSVFNSDALRDAKLYKGHIPARYGSRLSSVLEIKMKEGNNQQFHAQGGIGLISSRLTLEAPIVKDKGSFIISGRRTYVDLITKAVTHDKDIDNTKFYFYDLNLKANWKFNDKNRLFLSGYFGRDIFGYRDDDDETSSEASFSWGNTSTSLRYNHIFNSRLFSNTTIIYSDYNYRIRMEEKGYTTFFFDLGAGIEDISFKNDFNYYLNDKNKMNFGLEIIHHTLKPSTFESSERNEELEKLNLSNRYVFENAAYISNEQEISQKLKIYYGLRFTNFIHLGGSEFTQYNKDGAVILKKEFKRWEALKTFNKISPRISLSYMLNQNSSFKFAFAKTHQFLHLMSNSSSSNPTDVWMPSGLNIPAQTSYQESAGYFKNLKDGLYEFSAEIYYRNIQNVVDYRTGARVTLNPEIEKDLIYGKAKAYGLELLLRKKTGKFTGWISYTLSRSLKQFDKINHGNWFSATQDRIHDASIVANYKLSERTHLGAVWVYYTGNAVTFPAGFYQYNGREYPYFTERNGGRMPDYHRMDISITLYNKPDKKFRSNWNFSVYNVYGHMNPYLIYFSQESYNNTSLSLKPTQITLFRWVPSVTYNFKF